MPSVRTPRQSQENSPLDLVTVGKTGGLGARQARSIAREIQETVRTELGVERT